VTQWVGLCVSFGIGLVAGHVVGGALTYGCKPLTRLLP